MKSEEMETWSGAFGVSTFLLHTESNLLNFRVSHQNGNRVRDGEFLMNEIHE